MPEVLLREVIDSDLPPLYAFHHDEASIRMATVMPRDHAAFTAHWARLRADGNTLIRIIVSDGQVAGYAFTFDRTGQRELGYWLGRPHWGRGLATVAAQALVRLDRTRPLYGVVATHNAASRRVLEKCGFVLIGEEPNLAVIAGQTQRGYRLRLQ